MVKRGKKKKGLLDKAIDAVTTRDEKAAAEEAKEEAAAARTKAAREAAQRAADLPVGGYLPHVQDHPCVARLQRLPRTNSMGELCLKHGAIVARQERIHLVLRCTSRRLLWGLVKAGRHRDAHPARAERAQWLYPGRVSRPYLRAQPQIGLREIVWIEHQVGSHVL